MIFLSETKMTNHRIIGVRRRMGYCNGFDVALIGRAGGLSLWWDESVYVIMNDFSKHFIDAQCSLVDSQTVFRFTNVYGTACFWRG